MHTVDDEIVVMALIWVFFGVCEACMHLRSIWQDIKELRRVRRLRRILDSPYGR